MECPGIQEGRKFITAVFQLECPGIQGGRSFVILVIQLEFPCIQGGWKFIIVVIQLEFPGIQGWRSFIILVIKLECPCFQGRPATASYRDSEKYNPHIHIFIYTLILFCSLLNFQGDFFCLVLLTEILCTFISLTCVTFLMHSVLLNWIIPVYG